MKITQISAYPAADGKTSVQVSVEIDLSVTEATSSILALFAGAGDRYVASAPGTVITPSTAQTEAFTQVISEDAEILAHPKMADAPVAAETKATRTRRPRTNPDAAPEIATELNAAPVAEQRRRTRVTAEEPKPEVKVITDADLAKACSNAAAIIGIEVVQAVIADFHVKSMQELAPDVRERFLGELNDEINLAKAELEGGK